MAMIQKAQGGTKPSGYFFEKKQPKNFRFDVSKKPGPPP